MYQSSYLLKSVFAGPVLRNMANSTVMPAALADREAPARSAYLIDQNNSDQSDYSADLLKMALSRGR